MGPFPAAEACSEGGSLWLREGLGGGGSGEEACDFCDLGWEKGSYAADVPGVYAQGSLASGGWWSR